MRKDNTIEAFFALVRAGLWETEVQLSSYGVVDYEHILQIAQEQAVVGLVAAGLEHVTDVKVPQMCALQFAGETMQLEQRNKEMNVYIGELIEEMRSDSIYALLVKGQGIAQCYNRPYWRSLGDVDLLLSDDNYEKAKAFILPKGVLTEPEEAGKRHLAMQVGQWAVELHGTLRVGLSTRVDRMLNKVQYDIFYGGQVRSWMNGNVQVFLPAVNEDAVYVFAHILQHFYKGGIGLRQICDWSRLLWTYKDKLNCGLLESRIRKAGLMSEWNAFYNLAGRYLGLPDLDSQNLQARMSDHGSSARFMSYDSSFDKTADRIMEFVLEVGNFGHNRDNSYFRKHSYFVRKCISAWRRVKDLCRHARIFPINSVRFFFGIIYNGIVSTVRGE